MAEARSIAVAKQKPVRPRGRPRKRALFSKAISKLEQHVRVESPELNWKKRETHTDVQKPAGGVGARISTNNYIAGARKRRGAPLGNRNALRHGRFTRAALARRAESVAWRRDVRTLTLLTKVLIGLIRTAEARPAKASRGA